MAIDDAENYKKDVSLELRAAHPQRTQWNGKCGPASSWGNDP